MIIFKGFLPRNSAQNLLLRGSLTQENSAQKVLVLRSSCRVPLSRRVRYAGPSVVWGRMAAPPSAGHMERTALPVKGHKVARETLDGGSKKAYNRRKFRNHNL